MRPHQPPSAPAELEMGREAEGDAEFHLGVGVKGAESRAELLSPDAAENFASTERREKMKCYNDYFTSTPLP